MIIRAVLKHLFARFKQITIHKDELIAKYTCPLDECHSSANCKNEYKNDIFLARTSANLELLVLWTGKIFHVSTALDNASFKVKLQIMSNNNTILTLHIMPFHQDPPGITNVEVLLAIVIGILLSCQDYMEIIFLENLLALQKVEIFCLS